MKNFFQLIFNKTYVLFIEFNHNVFNHLFWQVKGHQRVPSDSKEFHEVTKRDAQTQLEKELDKLLQTSPNEEDQAFDTNEMARFSALFSRFLQEEGPSVDWDHIQKLPTDAVKNYDTLKTPTDESVSILYSIKKTARYILIDYN